MLLNLHITGPIFSRKRCIIVGYTIDANFTRIYHAYALYRGFAVIQMPVISLDGTRDVIKIGRLLV